MERNKNKTNLIRKLGRVDIEELAEKISLLSANDWDTEEDFKANYNKKPKGALNSTQHIILRFSNKQKNPFQYESYSRWKEYSPILIPLMEAATKEYFYEKGVFTRVMLAKLPPKSFISPHTDGNETGSIPHKIHIPIQSNEASFFFINEEKFHLEEGKAYEVNNAARHAVVNNGTTDRIHLIFEYLDYHIQSEIIKQEIDKQA